MTTTRGTAFAQPRLEPVASIRLTGPGAITVLLGGSFLFLLFGAETGWNALADAAFVSGCGSVTYYTKPSGLRHVVISPPLVFCAACIAAQALTADGAFAALAQILLTLGDAAPWLFTAAVLTGIIAFGRGYRVDLNPARHRLAAIWAGLTMRG